MRGTGHLRAATNPVTRQTGASDPGQQRHRELRPGETASPITAVTLSASLAEVPLSATLVVTPSPLAAASEAQLDVTLAVHRHVSVFQYLVIPVCSGAVLAALLIIATVAFGVPRSRRPARPPRSGRRNAHLDKEDFWRRPLYAASAWTWGDSWVTNITAVGTLIGTVLTASSGVAALLPGVDQGRFSLLLATAGGVSVIAPLIFALLNYRFSRQNPATARIMQISLPAGHGGFTVTMPVGGSVAASSGGTLDSGQALSPGTTLDVPVNGDGHGGRVGDPAGRLRDPGAAGQQRHRAAASAADHAQPRDQRPAERRGRHDRSRPDGAGGSQVLVHRAGGHHPAVRAVASPPWASRRTR